MMDDVVQIVMNWSRQGGENAGSRSFHHLLEKKLIPSSLTNSSRK
jgi:hypothetical protein